MPRFLAAERVAAIAHFLPDEAVTDVGHNTLNALACERFYEAEVGHNRCYDGIAAEVAVCLHIPCREK